MSAAFTPGPWDWWDMDNHVRVTEAAEQRLICEVTLPSDARLIAAAPELYEALEDCCKRLRVCAAVGGNSPSMIEALMERFEAPLAKARGDQ